MVVRCCVLAYCIPGILNAKTAKTKVSKCKRRMNSGTRRSGPDLTHSTSCFPPKMRRKGGFPSRLAAWPRCILCSPSVYRDISCT
ncbi:hypothetical protein BDN71DRAFT_929844 [Pleurotus eryngii]|uniref:Uncharacterized protein n=1 Tax=Pleurotus eryngii TaxID=5323 RepID=A0A9P5ZVL1_PLEER|nr:hypothetical protein BDN71DRAFT_929844 [Pleurotus eryngii]